MCLIQIKHAQIKFHLFGFWTVQRYFYSNPVDFFRNLEPIPDLSENPGKSCWIRINDGYTVTVPLLYLKEAKSGSAPPGEGGFSFS
jgi:hypothetical protein